MSLASPALTTIAQPQFKRVLIKVSGEALMGSKSYGQDDVIIDRICQEIKQAMDMGVQICMVVGGGNIYRGMSAAARGMERSSADYMGMLATVLNALAMQNALEKIGIDTRVLSAIHMMEVCEPYVRRRAIRHMERGRVVICAAGTGNPFFTTDTAAALRASELGCDGLFKGTQVDGIYTSDPKLDATATRFDSLDYQDVLVKNLKVMDASAIALARDNSIPIIVFSIHKEGQFARVLRGEGEFTIVRHQRS
ncbi:MAG: UMP kinase [Alphaproteobacteria bacterium]|nr:MAG: UMP kinase [Alphaproteobacteria bacterium]TAF13545.1 MAG: UMP kinase [Alphaproteobacteria bacterium]TAF40381.1 MAG: UMP kinase [Alphaproteobacteria bacterium]TAF77518.1 MAG: UMP kinase [Alphaproteobacteria bacterium]